jgi:hypothetical protein
MRLLSIDLIKGDCRYEIFDLNGKSMKIGIISQSISTVDISNISSGIYVLKINSGKEIFSQRIIIK